MVLGCFWVQRVSSQIAISASASATTTPASATDQEMVDLLVKAEDTLATPDELQKLRDFLLQSYFRGRTEVDLTLSDTLVAAEHVALGGAGSQATAFHLNGVAATLTYYLMLHSFNTGPFGE